jgi:hypothetical protein
MAGSSQRACVDEVMVLVWARGRAMTSVPGSSVLVPKANHEPYRGAQHHGTIYREASQRGAVIACTSESSWQSKHETEEQALVVPHAAAF